MAAGGMDLYSSLQQGINADAEAGRRLIYNRHWIEVGAGFYSVYFFVNLCSTWL